MGGGRCRVVCVYRGQEYIGRLKVVALVYSSAGAKGGKVVITNYK